MDVRSILKISGGEATFTDAYGAGAPSPGITLGVITRLILDMRAEGGQDDIELPAIPLAELADCDSYYIAIDNDWSQGTAPKMTRTSGISVVAENGRTLFQADLPNTAAIPGLAEVIEAAAAKSITLNCEIGGSKAGIGDVFAYSFSLVIRNRIWLPDGSPEELPGDPDYLNTVQVTALINSAVASALEDIQGDPGPPPTIAIGDVDTGEEAAANLIPGEMPGEYTLDLTLPRGQGGAPGVMPSLAIGTVTEGAAAAEIQPAGDGYALNLTIPRGLAGAGVTPAGIWNVSATYALNDAVRHAGAWWRSLANSNTGHAPPIGSEDDSWWEVIVKDGIDAQPFLRVYNSTDDPDDASWHDTYQPGDTHFRDSINGGATWTAPVPLSIAAEVIALFNIDAITNWKSLTPGAAHSTGVGKYMRARQEGGAWGEVYEIHDQDPQELRAQFSAGDADPTWHATLQPGDTRVRFFNALSSIDMTIVISDGTFNVVDIQLCAIEDPWHATYDPETDTHWKLSIDSGATWTKPIPMQGKSAYETWLAEGNTGTVEVFLESLRCQLPAGQKGQVLMLGANGEPVWGDLASYTPVPPPPEEPEPAEPVELQLTDLPDGVEKRIWEFLPVRRPADGRALHLFWQSSANGLDWGTLYSSATHPHCVRTRGAASLVDFDTTYGPAMLPVEYIPVLEIHLRTCWGFLDDDNIWHKGDWTYHNTLGVRLSLEGQPLEKPDYYNPEYFIIPIPDGTDQCEFRLSTDDNFREEQVLFSNTIYTAEVRGFFFDGQDLLPATPQTVETLPVPFNAEAFEGQWFVFKRRGTPKYNIRAVWTGDNPVIYEWSPERAFVQKEANQ